MIRVLKDKFATLYTLGTFIFHIQFSTSYYFKLHSAYEKSPLSSELP
jgi:hypothetical protein